MLQATLTLNGLVGGVILGLFSLGIFFKKANVKGAFFGGLLSIVCVTVIGIASQVKNVDEIFLESSIDKCDCISNSTLQELKRSNELLRIMEEDADDGWLDSLVKVSYMYYSMIGTFLTIIFGLVFSKLFDILARQQKLNVKTIHDVNKSYNPHLASVTFATGRKLSSFIHHVARDVSHSTMRVESYIKEVMSHTNLHLPLSNSDLEDRKSILSDESDEENVDVAVVDCDMLKDDKRMFFIGHPECDEVERRVSLKENLMPKSSTTQHHHYN